MNCATISGGVSASGRLRVSLALLRLAFASGVFSGRAASTLMVRLAVVPRWFVTVVVTVTVAPAAAATTAQADAPMLPMDAVGLAASTVRS